MKNILHRRLFYLVSLAIVVRTDTSLEVPNGIATILGTVRVLALHIFTTTPTARWQVVTNHGLVTAVVRGLDLDLSLNRKLTFEAQNP